MGLNLETLVGILVILILLIAADGFRRMLRERATRLRMSIRPSRRRVQDDDDDHSNDEHNPELPSGGARRVQRHVAAPGPDSQQALFDDEPDDDELYAQLEPEPEPVRAAPAARPDPLADKVPPRPAAPRQDLPQPAPAARAEPSRAARTPAPAAEPMEVVVVHLVAPAGERFAGATLLALLLESGLRYGEMDIFHCHRNEQGRDVLQFSMANAVVPGTFDIDAMEEQLYAGMTFFMGLPGPSRPVAALERMLDTVRMLAEALGGELKDEHRNVLTPQTMEHLRERVREFERRWHLLQEQ